MIGLISGGKASMFSICLRRSSITARTSDFVSTTRGVMNSTSSVRSFLSSCSPNSPPRNGMRDSSGMPSERVLARVADEAAHDHRLPALHRDTSSARERVLIGGASSGGRVAGIADFRLDVERDEAAGIDVRRHLQQHAGVDVLRRRRHGVGRSPPTSVCWLIGMRLPALIVAFWLSSAATCGLATTFVLP